MREYRRDDSRRRDSDEGDIARYERYRYGSDNNSTPQYNDYGSTWSVEQLLNDPNDPLYETAEEVFEQDEKMYNLGGVTQYDKAYIAKNDIDVSQLDAANKLAFAAKLSVAFLPATLAREVLAIFTPATVASMAAIFAVYMAAHATGVGQAIDIGMLIAGGVFFGMDAFTIFTDIAGFANAVNAQNEDDLEIAGQHLASAVAKVGVDALMTLLTSKIAKKIAPVEEPGTTRDLIESGGKNNPNPDNGSMRSIENVNPGYPKQGRTLNCVNCTVATDATLDGRPAQALESTETSIKVLERQYGNRFTRVRSEEQIIKMFQEAGNGKRGIVLVGQRIEGSRRIAYHVFNVANQEGTVRFLDGQTSKVGASINDLVASIASISVLKTN